MSGSERRLSIQKPGPSGVLEHQTVTIRIPKGIIERHLIRCAGLGQPGLNGGDSGGKALPKGEDNQFGDLYTVVEIVVPDHISSTEEEAWESLRDKSNFKPHP